MYSALTLVLTGSFREDSGILFLWYWSICRCTQIIFKISMESDLSVNDELHTIIMIPLLHWLLCCKQVHIHWLMMSFQLYLVFLMINLPNLILFPKYSYSKISRPISHPLHRMFGCPFIEYNIGLGFSTCHMKKC